MIKLRNILRRGSDPRNVMNTFSSDGVRSIDHLPGRKFVNRLRSEWQEYVTRIPPYPGGFAGRGIVICAGGWKYLTCAWVNISLLRKYGCTLPIEVWYMRDELTPDVIQALGTLNVECRDAMAITQHELNGLSLKPFAILNSRFKEVLYLDADNTCTADPGYLFETEEYRRYGAVFWPDIWTTEEKNPIWKIVDTESSGMFEQESGQILIDKERCWREMNLCMFFNYKRLDYYRLLLGDKDTFKFAWLALKSDFWMIRTPVGICGYTDHRENMFFGLSMVQHDPAGKVIFVHRNLLTWDLTQDNERIWKEIKRFRRNESSNRMIWSKHFRTGNGQGFGIIDFKGEVETVGFDELLGDFETECMDILKALRSSAFYNRFLLHIYFVFYKPAYIHNN